VWSGARSAGEFVVYTPESIKNVKRIPYDYSYHKFNKISKFINNNNLGEYFDLNGIFDDILMDDKYPFYEEYGLARLDNEEIYELPDIKKLQKEFKLNPIEFCDKYIYTGNRKPSRFYKKDEPLIEFLTNNEYKFNYDHFMDEHREYALDEMGEPTEYVYKGKKYFILNYSDNVDFYL